MGRQARRDATRNAEVMTAHDLTPDQLLTTTRSVRRRLDLTRAVPRELIEECLQVAMQAPTGSNLQGWQWVVVDDPDPQTNDYAASIRGQAAAKGAALITRGLVEITRFGEALGARRETFMGLAGMGDLILTCGSPQSRNMSLGRALGEGRGIETRVRGPLEGHHRGGEAGSTEHQCCARARQGVPDRTFDGFAPIRCVRCASAPDHAEIDGDTEPEARARGAASGPDSLVRRR